MKEEMQRAQSRPPLGSLFRTPELRRRICVLLFLRLANMMPMFGLVLHLQYLGNNVFLLQTLFGVASFLSSFVTLLLLNFLELKTSQTMFLCLVGIIILSFTYVPEEMQNLRVVLSTLGVLLGSMSVFINVPYTNKLLPTATRATALGIIGILSSLGGALAPLLMILRTYYAPLPWIIYAVIAIPGGLSVFFLPETRNQPLPDTVQDLERSKSSACPLQEFGTNGGKAQDKESQMMFTSK